MAVVLRPECTRRGPSGSVILVLPFHVAPCTHLRGVCLLALLLYSARGVQGGGPTQNFHSGGTLYSLTGSFSLWAGQYSNFQNVHVCQEMYLWGTVNTQYFMVTCVRMSAYI